MRQTHTYARRLLVVLALTLPLALVGSASAETPAAAPINDNYLASLNLNQPHTALNRADTLSDVRNTSAASIQSDIFSPPQSGAPAELTGCNGISEGRTIWYDFYPDSNGLIRVRTSAEFSTVMAVMPFNPKTLLPETAQRKCAVNQTSSAQELFDEVKAGGSYTVQIGGVENAGGTIESLFDYLVQPKHLQAEPTLEALPLSSGVRVVNLSVSSSAKALVRVRCTHGCSPQSKTGKKVSFSKLRGTVLKNGSSLKIYATAKNMIGVYIEYKIHPGGHRFTKIQRCLAPGGSKPVKCE